MERLCDASVPAIIAAAILSDGEPCATANEHAVSVSLVIGLIEFCLSVEILARLAAELFC